MKSRAFALAATILTASILLLAAVSIESAAAPPEGPAPPPARQIPGINAEDPYPGGCVDCHIVYPEMNMDTRFSTLLKEWAEQVEPGLLAKAQSSAPAGITLSGKHPAASGSTGDVPASCLKCHGKSSKKAPPFARLIHRLHLVGGEENNFMTVFQGQCTYCHKMQLATGEWSLPSGAEK